ncbi:SDR family oxidoreductase [Lentzea nigeriaca]|uniref:SDR family oxidoreductase n=1 Tax=Lentzea nigeriaca TaxID=1128665 RepID=UPI00195AAFA1|nr:SDR family oxidoreductase [Lentzea nigeriaca]MBM7864939.1 NAD(P)-dependent dehydrogenase (short-subunit alcohol dehydrogenase family) [Lentzea nigeriaca]
MDFNGAAVLVTGANRGLGRVFAQELVRRGAKVYAGARNPASVVDDGVIPVQLDVTDDASVAAAAKELGDVSIVINNAGVLVGGGDVDSIKTEFDVNFYGLVRTTDEFAPILKANGGGVLVNVLSVLSFVGWPGARGYAASKAAAWSLTKSTRELLREQGTRVVAVHAGSIDTDMASSVDAPKITPGDVVSQVLQAIQNGDEEVLADDLTRSVKAALAS